MWKLSPEPVAVYFIWIHVNISNFKKHKVFWFTVNRYKCSLFLLLFFLIFSCYIRPHVAPWWCCRGFIPCMYCVCSNVLRWNTSWVTKKMYFTCENTEAYFQELCLCFIALLLTAFFFFKIWHILVPEREHCISSEGHRSVPDAFLKSGDHQSDLLLILIFLLWFPSVQQ